MCGRFTLSRPGEVLEETIALLGELDRLVDQGLAEPSRWASLEPRYNVAPTQPVPVLRTESTGVGLAILRWGLPRRAAAIGHRAQAPGGVHINARAESLVDKPTFRNAFRNRRCVVLADGFYEWKKGTRQPFHFHPTSRRGLCFAGLWSEPPWLEAPAGSGDLSSASDQGACCIVTTSANEVVAPIHHRMPVILESAGLRLWLDPEITDPEALQPTLRPLSGRLLAGHPVSRRVNRVVSDEASLIVEVAEAPPLPENLTLF